MTTFDPSAQPESSGPHRVGPRLTRLDHAEQTLSSLWQHAGIELRLYTDNLFVVTEQRHLTRILKTLDELGPGPTGRQVVVVLGAASGEAEVSLVGAYGSLVERLVTHAPADDAAALMAELLRPAASNHLWWASAQPPGTAVLTGMAQEADQLILDTSSFALPPGLPCPVSDLAWARTARWRELTAELFDDPTAAAHLSELEQVTVRFAGDDARPARLFAAWFASRLGWTDLARVQVLHASDLRVRDRGDLMDLEMVGGRRDGPDVRFVVEADGDAAHVLVTHDQQFRAFEVNLPPLSLAQGLADVMRLPAHDQDFQEAHLLLTHLPAQMPIRAKGAGFHD